MSGAKRERLYNLLPAVYRVRDMAQGEPLRALLGVLESELELLEGDIERLYNNWFIETCEEWVVPYIGDLLSVRGLLPVQDGAFSHRALVANTLAYRRRKGTAAVLEQLTHDATGWPAKAVELFELLATTQYLNHLRAAKGGTISLRDANRLELINGPFERAAHTADVRHIDNSRGKYNIPNVGLYLWRLQSYPVIRSTACAATQPPDGRCTFNPLGLSAPLFNRPRTETEITQLAAEHNVPGPLRRRPLHDELEAIRQALVDGSTPPYLYFNRQPVLQLFVQANINDPLKELLPEEILICHLGDWKRPVSKTYTRKDGTQFATWVAVDPVLGRLAFPTNVKPSAVLVNYAYGFSGDLGGGPYDRQASTAKWLDRFKPTGGEDEIWQMGVTQDALPNQDGVVKTIAEAVQAWNSQPPGAMGIITIMDSCTYTESLTGSHAITVPAGSRLAIVAADWPEVEAPDGLGQKERVFGQIAPSLRHPVLSGDLSVQGLAAAGPINPGELVLDGLLVEGKVTVSSGDLGRLQVAHCTIVPGKGRLEVVSGNARLSITLDRSICGLITLPNSVPRLSIVDSIVDGAGGVAITARDTAVDLQTTTVLGTTEMKSLEAGNCIFTGRVSVARCQVGCVGFCYLPIESRAPRRYRCQPTSTTSAGGVFPQFTSDTYGQSGYGQLATACPSQISSGAQDEGEMGAFHFLQQTQRIKSLGASLDEYLRFGLEAGLFFVT